MDPQPANSARTNEARPTQLAWWLLVVAALVYGMVIVGGATRLTESGLSITKWEPVSGTFPPLSSDAWHKEFDHYRQSPQYQIINNQMSLGQFKSIFWWEWAHRLLGRIVGLVLVIPFVWFLVRRRIPPGYGWRIAGLSALLALQGVIGWWMVASGLIDRPDVAHQRLALHLTTAFVLLGALLWTALDLRALGAGRTRVAGRPKRWVVPFFAALFVQFILGAFVAGLEAGNVFNTWPTMDGTWVPQGAHDMSPWWVNMVDNPVAVQFLHRWWAVVAAVFALVIVTRLYRAGAKNIAGALEGVVLAQFILGVFTLLHSVPIALGILHQAVGAMLLVVTVVAAHWAFGGAKKDSPSLGKE